MSHATAEVLIPHWNRAESLRLALGALRRQTLPCPVTVLDNGSTDGSVQMVRLEYPEVGVVELGRNTGFGAALNEGARRSDADLLVFLNNDTEPDSRFLELVTVASKRSEAEMVAPSLRRPDGTVDSSGIVIDRALNAYDAAHLEPYDPAAAADRHLLAPTGGAAAVARAAFERVGGFDEAIFAYLEDVDLGIRLRMEGARCEAAPEAYAWHRHSATLGSGSARKNELLGRARAHLLWKWGANLTGAERAAGAVADAVVYAGKMAVDRNAAAALGRFRARRARPGPRPAPDPRFARVPRAELGLVDGLRLRVPRR